MSNDVHVSDLTAGYALGALSDDDRSQVDAHIASCAQCRDDVTAMLGIAGMLPLACEAAEPSGSLKDRVLGAAAAEARAGESLARRPVASTAGAPESMAAARMAAAQRPPAFWQWASGLAAAAAIVLGVIALDQAQQRAAVQKNVDQLTADLAVARHDGLVARDDAITGRAVMAALATGTYWTLGPLADAQGKMWRCAVVQPHVPGHNAMLLATLPDPPHGMAYQIWVGRKGDMHKAGMVTHGGVTMMDMPTPMRSGDVVAFSIAPPSGDGPAASQYAMEMTL